MAEEFEDFKRNVPWICANCGHENDGVRWFIACEKCAELRAISKRKNAKDS